MSKRIFKINQKHISYVSGWYDQTGVHDHFKNGHLPLTKRNTLKSKLAEVCEHIRNDIKIDLKKLFLKNVWTDGGFDVEIKNGLNIDVKCRDGDKYGFLIKKSKIKNDVIFSGYTVDLHYKTPIDKNLENLSLIYEGSVSAERLRELASEGKLIEKFGNSYEVPAEYFQ